MRPFHGPVRFSTGSLLDLVTKTEVIVRGLYHAAAADLEITLLHQEHSCVLSAATSYSEETRPAGVHFGVPEERRYMHGFGPNPGTWACGNLGDWMAWFILLFDHRLDLSSPAPAPFEIWCKIVTGLASSTGAPSRPAYWHRGIGYDYAFADVVGENVVRA